MCPFVAQVIGTDVCFLQMTTPVTLQAQECPLPILLELQAWNFMLTPLLGNSVLLIVLMQFFGGVTDPIFKLGLHAHSFLLKFLGSCRNLEERPVRTDLLSAEGSSVGKKPN